MTVPAIGQVIVKPGQYLEKFISLMREGAEVPFTDEEVASMRIYKDGEKVKKIVDLYDELVNWGIDIYDRDILDDLFRQLPPGSLESKDTRFYPFKDIEYQSITDPKKIETLSLNKIGKQVVSGRGGGTTKFEGKESDWTETLTCYALAFRQHVGRDVTAAEFKQFLIDGKNGNTLVRQVINQNVVASNMETQKVYEYGLSKGANDYARGKSWIHSGVNVANALYKSPYLKSGVNYDFYFGGTPEISWFKTKWSTKFNNTLQSHLRQLHNVSNDVKNYGSSVDDKWNPADIYALSKNLNKQQLKTTTMGFFPGQQKDWKKFVGKNRVAPSDEKVQQDMAELTRYNSWIHERIIDGTLIPISLKKALGSTHVDLISNPSIENFTVDVENIRVSWELTAQKIYIYFDAVYTMEVAGTKQTTKKKSSYFFDCRNFNKGENVQFELGAAGSSAKHGKASVGPAAMIIDMTSPTVGTLLKQTRKNFVRWMAKNNLSQEGARKAFENKIVNVNAKKIFTDNTAIDAITLNAGWPVLLGNYIKFLSKETGYDLNKPEKDLKNYFKSKIAAVELGWIMTSKKIQPIIKNNILKSLYLYASSQGLQIFDDSGLLKKSYFYNSSYVKVRD
jgi:hypothetical protein